MKIMIAPDSFKESLSTVEVVDSIARGIKKVKPGADIIKVPMADGGEGTVQALTAGAGGEIFQEKVTGPLGDEVEAFFGILGEGRTAVIEMAAASGLPLVPEEKRDPTRTTTLGTGELIAAALDKGVDKIILGIGGSATNDAGVGLAQALGAEFKNTEGREVGPGGGKLSEIASIDLSGLDSRLQEVDIEAACDVDNPLYGPEGAAYVYAPQKGADEEMTALLDENLRHLSEIIKKELGRDIQQIPGSGAAGGLGAGLVAFLGAELRPGVEIVLEVNDVYDKIKDVDLVFTGEGKIDDQTLQGKTVSGIAQTAGAHNIPVIALCGAAGRGADSILSAGITAFFPIIQDILPRREIYENTSLWLERTARQIMRVLELNIS